MTRAGESMIRGAQEALAFAAGEENSDCVAHIPDEVDVRRIRQKLELSQNEFARYFGVSVRTIQEWEQGRRVPSGASKVFLHVIDKEPEAVRRALFQEVA